MGHPRIITTNFNHETDAYFGVAKCVILPPQNLIHPVLPAKIQEGNFVLNSCQHSDEERAIEGCWITPEIYKAVELGYKIVRFIEVWHFPLKSKSFFKGYIDLWFKKKAKAKGYPYWANNTETQKKYQDRFLEENGIELDHHCIKEDKTKYAVAKLFLNTLWGYFCKNPEGKTQTEIFTKPGKFRKWLNDYAKVNKNFTVLDLNTLLVTHRIHDFKKHDGRGNILHGAFTTGWARMHLYEKGLQKKAAMSYILTPILSFIYRDLVKIRYLWEVKFGEFTDEIEPTKFGEEPDAPLRDRYCSAFMSGGPKNYCLELSFKNEDGSIPKPEDRIVSDFKTIRGFSLDEEARKKLNFTTMKRIVEDSATWAASSPEEIEELVQKFKCQQSALGIVNIDPLTMECFTVKVGDRRPPRGVKRSHHFF